MDVYRKAIVLTTLRVKSFQILSENPHRNSPAGILVSGLEEIEGYPVNDILELYHMDTSMVSLETKGEWMGCGVWKQTVRAVWWDFTLDSFAASKPPCP